MSSLMPPARLLQYATMLSLALTSAAIADEETGSATKESQQILKTDAGPNEIEASTEIPAGVEFEPYTEKISGTNVSFDLVPIPGGTFKMGSPEDEKGRNPDEGPVHKVAISPFWMGKHEVTWDEYDIWSYNLDIKRRKLTDGEATELDKIADAITRPTKPYTDMTFAMGHDGYPAISMTQLAAKMYCKWLTAKTGHYYRLPTEAEWEYACRAGTDTAYSWGNDPAKIDEYAWYERNAFFAYHPVGELKPNPWGLYDMHGNVAEWTLDAYDPGFYATLEGKVAVNPINVPVATEQYNHVVRGGSWRQSAEELRSAARMTSTSDWKQQDPQRPQSIWYLTDALHVGFRVVRPVDVPSKVVRQRLGLVPLASEVTEEGLQEGFINHEEE